MIFSVKRVTTALTCTDMARAALIAGPKNKFKRILVPWIPADQAKHPNKFWPINRDISFTKE